MGILGRNKAAIEPEPEEVSNLPVLPEPAGMTVIANGLTIVGNLQGEGDLQIEGVVEGQICLQGTVEVMAAGTVKGPIESTTVFVAGNVQGDIVAHECMRLESTGFVDGDITTHSFVVEEGGCLNGRTTMKKSKKVVPEKQHSKESPQTDADRQAAGAAAGSDT